jgi:RNA polymerase sigma-70 factor (ECF subfamily)
VTETIEGGTFGENRLDRTAQLNDFLRGVEQRAYVTARAMTRDGDESMDIVQDTMLRFVRRYSRKPEVEWRPLFFRILINRIRDHQRRSSVRGRVMSWFRHPDSVDPVDATPAPRGSDPAVAAQGLDAMQALEAAVQTLPVRQREAFVLRCLEGMDVAQTAASMGCSPGTVKTHYSRALSALRGRLGEYQDE